MNRKIELKFWIFALFVGLCTMLMDFDKSALKIAEYIPQVNRVLNSSIYASFADMRRTESDFWSLIKGSTQEVIVQPTSTPAPAPTVIVSGTPIAVTPSPIPTPDNYNGSSKIVPPFTVQILGDSMILEGFGPQMKAKLLEYQGLTVYDNGRYSTGLNRVDYFDWYKESIGLIGIHDPDVLIVMFGANDGQDIVADDGSIGRLGSDKWKEVYRKRVVDYLALIAPKVGLIYWVGHPIPRTSDFYGKFSTMNPIYQEECAKISNCRYVDEWTRFSVDGKYSPTLADDNGLVQTVKGSDGVHVTVHGGRIMADEVIKMMKLDIVMEKK